MPGIIQEGWLACSRELKTPSDLPYWTASDPLVELSNLPTTYYSIHLPGFNEEEYAHQPAKKEDGNIVVAQGNKLAKVE